MWKTEGVRFANKFAKTDEVRQFKEELRHKDESPKDQHIDIMNLCIEHFPSKLNQKITDLPEKVRYSALAEFSDACTDQLIKKRVV